MLDCIGQGKYNLSTNHELLFLVYHVGEFGKVYKANIIVGKCSHTVAVKTIKGQ